MSKRHAETEGIVWEQVDVRQMDQIPSESIDVAFDKGTLDVWIHGSLWDPPDDVRDNTGRYVQEVRLKWSPLQVTLPQESHLTYRVGLSCPQIRWHVYLHNIPATSLYKASS
jgi:hypothetical protein